MSSRGRRSKMKPRLPWVALTSMAVVIPMPASTAIRGGAKRPDSGRGWVLEDLAAGPGGDPGGGEIGQPLLGLTAGSPGHGPRHPLVELPGRQASPAAPQIFVP